MYIRNISELPVMVNTADLSVPPWGYELAPSEDAPARDYLAVKKLAIKKLGNSQSLFFAPGNSPDAVYDQPRPPMVSITRVVVTGSAGLPRRCSRGKP